MKSFNLRELSLKDQFSFILNNSLYYRCPAIVLGIKSIPQEENSSLISELNGEINKTIPELIDACAFCGEYNNDNCAVKRDIMRIKGRYHHVTKEEIIEYRNNKIKTI